MQARRLQGVVALAAATVLLAGFAGSAEARTDVVTGSTAAASYKVGIVYSRTGLLAAYVHKSPSFGDIYGPLAGVFALLLWSLLSSIALFYGTALCAQLEAVRSGHPQPAYDDPGRPHEAKVDGNAL